MALKRLQVAAQVKPEVQHGQHVRQLRQLQESGHAIDHVPAAVELMLCPIG